MSWPTWECAKVQPLPAFSPSQSALFLPREQCWVLTCEFLSGTMLTRELQRCAPTLDFWVWHDNSALSFYFINDLYQNCWYGTDLLRKTFVCVTRCQVQCLPSSCNMMEHNIHTLSKFQTIHTRKHCFGIWNHLYKYCMYWQIVWSKAWAAIEK